MKQMTWNQLYIFLHLLLCRSYAFHLLPKTPLRLRQCDDTKKSYLNTNYKCLTATSISSSTSTVDETSYSTLQNGSKNIPKEEVDVIVVGSGLAGLSCAALLSYSSLSTLVLESHDTVGGCAHSWTRRGFTFESGPSLYSGLSIDPSPKYVVIFVE